MAANKIKKPILLIHGEEDNNSGTLTMQVRFSILLQNILFLSFLHIPTYGNFDPLVVNEWFRLCFSQTIIRVESKK